MIAVVMAAKRTSLISVFRADGVIFPPCRGGELGEELERPLGRHFRTASTEARHGWTWRG